MPNPTETRVELIHSKIDELFELLVEEEDTLVVVFGDRDIGGKARIFGSKYKLIVCLFHLIEAIGIPLEMSIDKMRRAIYDEK